MEEQAEIPEGAVQLLNPYTGKMQVVYDLNTASTLALSQLSVTQPQLTPAEKPQKAEFNPYLDNPYLP